MSRPTLRVLTVLELLQAARRMSGAELARRLDVDRRTVRRYISQLEELGVPITAEHGRDGAYTLVAGFKLPPMMFTDDEAIALSVGLLAARGLGVPEAAPAVASAQAKLERVMPAPLKRRVSAVAETVTLDLVRPAASVGSGLLAALTAAAQSRRRVVISYRPRLDVDTEREFDPYGLAYRSGRWYVVGMCHLRRALRSFRLDRIHSVRPTDVNFSRPEDFDTLKHLRDALATLPRAHAIEVLLETDLATAQRKLFAAFGVLECVSEGVLLRSQADDLDWFARELTALPFDFRIRRPEALRTAVESLARRLLRLTDAAR
jgi:predicted DNA-binding transcriptional regulator YafY